MTDSHQPDKIHYKRTKINGITATEYTSKRLAIPPGVPSTTPSELLPALHHWTSGGTCSNWIMNGNQSNEHQTRDILNSPHALTIWKCWWILICVWSGTAAQKNFTLRTVVTISNDDSILIGRHIVKLEGQLLLRRRRRKLCAIVTVSIKERERQINFHSKMWPCVACCFKLDGNSVDGARLVCVADGEGQRKDWARFRIPNLQIKDHPG